MDLYSRQLYALGKDSLITMSNAKILIIGTETPFVEIMKNLILMGIGEITIADNRVVTKSDFDVNYYLKENDLGSDYVNLTGFRMGKLNPQVNINKYTKSEFPNTFLKSFTLIVVLKDTYDWSLRLHNLSIPHIISGTSRFLGYLFVDLIRFVSQNPNGEKNKSGLILNLNDTEIETVNQHDLSVNNKILIRNNEYVIKKILSPKKFIIDRHLETLINQLEKYEEIKIPKEFQFKSIDKCNSKNKLVETNYLSFGNNYLLLNKLYESKFKLTENGKVFINSIIGGIVVQNVINFINKCGTPINQFLIYDFSELEQLTLDDIDKKVFIVGAGALGCEHIKNLAYLGVKDITITDFDQIEKSNLSRQFLFRDKDIGKFKSYTAKKSIKKMKPEINIESLTLKVCKDTESKFNTKFYESIDCVFNALDNIEARKYMDSKCIDYDLPLFESGTLGTKANSQTVIPYLTESYSNSVVDDNTTIPLCTIKSFPYLPEHSVMWAKELFAELFSQSIEKVNHLDFE